uniref:Uncharacterized protein n=1 Tax=Octopus bimaculoides TaxID=37653 RepID=A0A0L8G7G7_OCTBM
METSKNVVVYSHILLHSISSKLLQLFAIFTGHIASKKPYCSTGLIPPNPWWILQLK